MIQPVTNQVNQINIVVNNTKGSDDPFSKYNGDIFDSDVHVVADRYCNNDRMSTQNCSYNFVLSLNCPNFDAPCCYFASKEIHLIIIIIKCKVIHQIYLYLTIDLTRTLTNI